MAYSLNTPFKDLSNIPISDRLYVAQEVAQSRKGNLVLFTSGGKQYPVNPSLAKESGIDIRVAFINHGEYNQSTLDAVASVHAEILPVEIYGIDMLEPRMQEFIASIDDKRIRAATAKRHLMRFAIQELDPAVIVTGARRVQKGRADFDFWMEDDQYARTAHSEKGIERIIYKCNPLLDWDDEAIKSYMAAHNLQGNFDHDEPARNEEGLCPLWAHEFKDGDGI